MKRWHYIVLIAIGITIFVLVYLYRQELGIAGPFNAATSDSDSSTQTASSPHPAHIVWQKLDRTPDGFKVEMPTDVKEIQIPAYNEGGGSDQVNMIFSYPDAATTYSVAWADNPPVVRVNQDIPDRILNMARDDAIARTQTTLINESRSRNQGYPIHDFAARNVGGGVFNSRLIVAGSHLYMLIASFPSASARQDRDVARFFNSFSVVSPTAQ